MNQGFSVQVVKDEKRLLYVKFLYLHGSVSEHGIFCSIDLYLFLYQFHPILISVFLNCLCLIEGFPGASFVAQLVKNPQYGSMVDLGLTPGLGRSSGEGKGSPHQYSGLENSMDSAAHGVAKSWTGLSDFPFPFPWWLRLERVCLQCGRPRFDPWVGKIPWRMIWQPTPVFLPGKSHG